MTEKLTKGIREKIRDAILGHRFNETEKQLDKQKRDFGLKVFNDIYSKKDRELMASLPDGWLQTTCRISVRLGLDYTQVPVPDLVRIPYKDYHSCLKVYDNLHKFSEEWAELKDEEKDLKAQKEKAKHEVMAVLERATTPNKLKEIWPEISDFVDKFAPPKKQLPAILLNKLNTELNLPPEEEK